MDGCTIAEFLLKPAFQLELGGFPLAGWMGDVEADGTAWKQFLEGSNRVDVAFDTKVIPICLGPALMEFELEVACPLGIY